MNNGDTSGSSDDLIEEKLDCLRKVILRKRAILKTFAQLPGLPTRAPQNPQFTIENILVSIELQEGQVIEEHGP